MSVYKRVRVTKQTHVACFLGQYTNA